MGSIKARRGIHFFSKVIHPAGLIISLYSFIFLFSCDSSGIKENDTPPLLFPSPITVRLNTDSGYSINQVTGDKIVPLINSKGDSVRTGIQIAAKAKRLDASSIRVSKPVPAAWTFYSPVLTNAHTIPKRVKVIKVDESKLKRFVTGYDTSSYVLLSAKGDTIPTGIHIPVFGIESPCIMPESVEALPMSIKSDSRYIFKYLETYHGLLESEIHTTLFDQRGNLWIASNEGVSCYDGKVLYHFTEKEGLLRNSVFYMMEDRKGNIWFDYGEGQVSCYDGRGFMHFTGDKRTRSVFLGNNSMLEDSKGNIWFRTLVNGLTRYDGKNFTHFTRREGLSSNWLRCIMEDSKGNIWLGTHGEGVSRYDGKSFTWFKKKDGLNHDIVSAIVEDRNGNFWFGTDSGVARYDGKAIVQFMEKDGLSNNLIGSAIQDRLGNLWFGTYMNGVTIFDGKKFIRITEEEGLMGKSIQAMNCDKNGGVWISSETGVSLFEPGNFTRYGRMVSDYFYRPAGVLKENSNGNIVVANDNGIFRFDDESIYQLTDRDSLAKQYFVNHMEDRNGNLWMAPVRNSLLFFDGKQITNFSINTELNHSLLEDRRGNLWIGTHKGVLIYDGKDFFQFTETDGLCSNVVFALHEDKKGNIWIGTRGGLARFDGKSFINYSQKEGLSNNVVRYILEDRRGNLWLSTNEGINHFDGKRFTVITKREGIHHKFVGRITEDKEGNVWMISHKGVSRVPAGYVDDLSEEAKFQSQTLKPGIINFRQKDGLKSLLNNGLIDKKNRLWIAESDWSQSLLVLDLELFLGLKQIPVISLTDVNINGKAFDFHNLSEDEKRKISFSGVSRFYNYPLYLKLPYYHNQLSFYFTAKGQVTNEQILYSYKMEGIANEWSKPSLENKAYYPYLPPGAYTFKVRAIGGSQIWGEEFEYTFEILPPWWFTWWAYVLYIIGFVAGLIVIFRWRTKTIKQENLRLEKNVEQRTKELKAAKEKVEHSLTELKATQTQLVQREKMASLGELTAGIAHEIQNPLNFVNNFSEVSNELIDEMKNELAIGNTKEANEIADDIKQNLEKINHHGKRADSIVKGMLQHSRTSSGQKEPTDINALCDEYLRLAYHGLRAKDKTFNAKFETRFDPSLPKLNVVPQDLGRVILNLINNAFYAVTEKKKQAEDGYEPSVTVSTKMSEGKVEISVKDNGNGIPENILDKIFQPFFTTKPTGQGTGLGLSLAYDIVTKVHGGELIAKTEKNGGAGFIIKLRP
jgi:ligand-binding sensor domain-containing protein/signal transduction histidine kinase